MRFGPDTWLGPGRWDIVQEQPCFIRVYSGSHVLELKPGMSGHLIDPGIVKVEFLNPNGGHPVTVYAEQT